MLRILPGSVEVEGSIVIAGVYFSGGEWDIRDLRYIRLEKEDWQDGDALINALGRLYDNSTGCLLKGNFKRN